jgi:hypothetical protein
MGAYYMLRARLELARPFDRGILSPLCLPFHHQSVVSFINQHMKYKTFSSICQVHSEGVEPTRFSSPDPKSGASASSATNALHQILVFHLFNLYRAIERDFRFICLPPCVIQEIGFFNQLLFFLGQFFLAMHISPTSIF